MALAGAVFPEWYWTPIFLIVATSPVMVVAFAVAAIVLGRRTGWGIIARLATALACALTAPAMLALVLGVKQSV
jgi:hypothetical protein